MDLGAGIAIASGVFGIVAVVWKIIPGKDNKDKHCEDHSGVCATLQATTDWLNKIEKKLDRVIEARGLTK